MRNANLQNVWKKKIVYIKPGALPIMLDSSLTPEDRKIQLEGKSLLSKRTLKLPTPGHNLSEPIRRIRYWPGQ